MEPTDLVAQRAQARVGTLLNGRWHLDKLVGVGGMAAVYAATNRNTKRVAIKILHAEISVDENARQRFLREGYAANQVGHRGAVAADDDGLTDDGLAFLVMELLEGETLEERGLRLGGTLAESEVLALMDQALATLQAAHDKRIVHRDLKPENLFLTHEGALKILDFGIARLDDPSGTPSQTRGVMGTPCFMAPEQARGRWQDVDERTDLWAIGATLFTLLSGRFVHQADTANETLVLAVTERAPAIATVVARITPALAELVDKSLAYEREARFQTAREFREAVRAVHDLLAGDESLPAVSVSQPRVSQASLPQPSTIGLTLGEGVAASVRSAQTDPNNDARPRSKAASYALGLGALVMLGVVGTRVGGEARRVLNPEFTHGAAAAALPVHAEGAKPGSEPAPFAPNPASSGPTTPSPAEVPTGLRSALTRPMSKAPTGVTKPKPKPAKIPTDPFLKRH